MKKNLLLALGIGLVGTALVGTALAQPQQLQGRALLQELQKGGYVLFFRHERTDMSQGSRETNFLDRASQNPRLWQDCNEQRNLNQLGRNGAIAKGAAIRQLQIPVGEVIASPFCRAFEHAQLSFGTYKINNDIVNTFSLPQSDARRVLAANTTKTLISTLPKTGNTMVVGHQPTFQDVTNIALEEGEAGISKPDGRGGFSVVARVKTDAWLGLEGQR
jgi:phosphohistidine phosphatase SixA